MYQGIVSDVAQVALHRCRAGTPNLSTVLNGRIASKFPHPDLTPVRQPRRSEAHRSRFRCTVLDWHAICNRTKEMVRTTAGVRFAGPSRWATIQQFGGHGGLTLFNHGAVHV